MLNREFKIIVIKMLTRSGEQFMNKVRITEREKIFKNTEITELKNIITVLKNSTEGFYNRLDKMEVRINKLENMVVQFMEQRNKKNFKKSEDSLRNLKDIIM